MVLHPDVQAKGQEEIDSVLGRDRLPTFADRLSLPYVEAIYREVMRLHPPVPLCEHFQVKLYILMTTYFLGVEHSTIEDDFYLGYHIPKGSFAVSFTVGLTKLFINRMFNHSQYLVCQALLLLWIGF